MTMDEAATKLRSVGASDVQFVHQDESRWSVIVLIGGERCGISAVLPHGLPKAVERLTEWIASRAPAS